MKQMLVALGLVVAVVTSSPVAVAQPQRVQSLKTPNHRVVLRFNCPEGTVTCNNIGYYGINFRTGASINLKGRTVHRLCQDRVTPCRFLGYEFFNGNTRYFVSEAGELTVSQGQRLLLREMGTWMPNNR
jgi:hypothetical protein